MFCYYLDSKEHLLELKKHLKNKQLHEIYQIMGGGGETVHTKAELVDSSKGQLKHKQSRNNER